MAVAQEYAKVEVPVGFSFVNVHPDLTPITNFNVFGGGGGFVYDSSSTLRVEADFNGYVQGSGLRSGLIGAGYTVGNLQGNVFTYMFGPQFKKPLGETATLAQALLGAAHSTYASIYNTSHGASASSNNNAFAMEFGGGLDFSLTRTIQLRPAETCTPALALMARAMPEHTTSNILPA